MTDKLVWEMSWIGVPPSDRFGFVSGKLRLRHLQSGVVRHFPPESSWKSPFNCKTSDRTSICPAIAFGCFDTLILFQDLRSAGSSRFVLEATFRPGRGCTQHGDSRGKEVGASARIVPLSLRQVRVLKRKSSDGGLQKGAWPREKLGTQLMISVHLDFRSGLPLSLHPWLGMILICAFRLGYWSRVQLYGIWQILAFSVPPRNFHPRWEETLAWSGLARVSPNLPASKPLCRRPPKHCDFPSGTFLSEDFGGSVLGQPKAQKARNPCKHLYKQFLQTIRHLKIFCHKWSTRAETFDPCKGKRSVAESLFSRNQERQRPINSSASRGSWKSLLQPPGRFFFRKIPHDIPSFWCLNFQAIPHFDPKSPAANNSTPLRNCIGG